MKLYCFPTAKDLAEILKRPELPRLELEKTVSEIMDKVRREGDSAVSEYTARFDKSKPLKPFFDSSDLKNAYSRIPAELAEALEVASSNIRAFHLAQKEEFPVIESTPGVRCWRKSIAIEKVGLYIPGGSAPLFSSLLMLAIPAKLAGCSKIVVCSPPNPEGLVPEVVLAAAHVAGLEGVFPIGGAQAIAAMTHGTKSIPAVDKLFGPGNQFVTQAKMLAVNCGVSIDIPAGPSELAILADSSAEPRLIAVDLLSQAEHGPDSHLVLVSDSRELLEASIKEVEKQASDLSRSEVALLALSSSAAILVSELEKGMEIINAYAPEHLILSVREPEVIAEQVINAGSVFLGHYTPESLGDYASGTNHTLPTRAWARSTAGVSLDSFVKKVTFQQASRSGLEALSKTVITMAEAEGLEAHARAVRYRLGK